MDSLTVRACAWTERLFISCQISRWFMNYQLFVANIFYLPIILWTIIRPHSLNIFLYNITSLCALTSCIHLRGQFGLFLTRTFLRPCSFIGQLQNCKYCGIYKKRLIHTDPFNMLSLINKWCCSICSQHLKIEQINLT